MSLLGFWFRVNELVRRILKGEGMYWGIEVSFYINECVYIDKVDSRQHFCSFY